MIINGIEYGILLFINDEAGNPFNQEFFNSFEEMNEFITENKDFDEFYGCDVCYTIVEIVNGEPQPYSWTQDILFTEMNDSEIQKEINDFIEYEKEVKELFQEVNDQTAFRNPEFKEGDYKKKFSRIGEISYVCPYCINSLEECRCIDFPYHLIQIDTKILPIIRILNQKGYRTVQCCAGHPSDGYSRCPETYIGFKELYDFNVPFPAGAVYRKHDNTLSYIPKEGASYNELVGFQNEVLNKLLKWAECLDDIR